MSVFEGFRHSKHDRVGDEPTEMLTTEPQNEEHEKLSHKIINALDGEERRKREEEEERQRLEQQREAAQHNVEAQRGFGSQIHDILDSGRCRTALEQVELERLEAQAQEERKKHSNISDKLHGALDVPSGLHQRVHGILHRDEHSEEQKPEQEQHISDKVKEILKGAPEEPVEHKEHHTLWVGSNGDAKPQEKEGWSDKLHVLSRKAEPQPEQGWLQEKINGIKGNNKKDKDDEYKNLNRAIDFVQEHVLRKED